MEAEVIEKVGEREQEFIEKFGEFAKKRYRRELDEAAVETKPLEIDFSVMERFGTAGTELGELLLSSPDEFFSLAGQALKDMDVPEGVKVRVFNLPETVNIKISDLRSKHIGRFITVEGTVRRASEIRPEIMETVWECPDETCREQIRIPRRGKFIGKVSQCPKCRNKFGFRQISKTLLDTRWATIEEPFELLDSEKPSQVHIIITEDLVSMRNRRNTDPGNRLKLAGVLREIPKGKEWSVQLDFYLEVNHVQPMEIGWEKLDITPEDEKTVRELAQNPQIYELLVDSLAPSIYGLREIKESIIMQMFGGVPRVMSDKTRIRGDIHILLIGDPASGKSQLLKLVPEIVPRGKYVSGKGTTTAGLTASVIKDELFMGGWVLEAGAMVLTNKGTLAIDEFEKMSPEDQVAMHEALEQGSVSIAKASIVATLPAKTSVLAGGNPKFGRFDPYVPIAKQITVADTLLSRFDLKFAMRDIPNAEKDKLVVDHILRSRDSEVEGVKPAIDPEFIKKYIAYSKSHCLPELTKETGKKLKKYYLDTRKKAEGGTVPIPITLRQFEALIRLSEASAKVQLSDKVRISDVERAIRLMDYSMQQLGMTETGEIDIDRVEGGTSAADRSKIRNVLEIIDELSAKSKEISMSELLAVAKKKGIPDLEDIIEKLKREGMLFEPSPGFIQKV